MENIYIITAVHIGDPIWQNDILCIERQRIVGWFPALERAMSAVIHNENDLNESGHYDHCVIEKTSLGLYPYIGLELWFEWKRGRYAAITKPEDLGDIHNLGIG